MARNKEWMSKHRLYLDPKKVNYEFEVLPGRSTDERQGILEDYRSGIITKNEMQEQLQELKNG